MDVHQHGLAGLQRGLGGREVDAGSRPERDAEDEDDGGQAGEKEQEVHAVTEPATAGDWRLKTMK